MEESDAVKKEITKEEKNPLTHGKRQLKKENDEKIKKEIIEDENNPPLIGETFDFEDFLSFAVLKARASELEALIVSERAISKGEKFGFASPIQKYILPIIIGILGMGIVLYILKTIGLLPI